MNTINFKKVKHLFKSKDDANINHPSDTSWVSPDLKMKQGSLNNNGPIGWLKVVDDKK